MKLVILTTLFLGTIAVPMFQSVAVKDDGSYRFSYETGKEGGSHSRTEIRNSDGVVIGKYSYEDPNGAIREVSYRADDLGYVANGDVSVEGAPKGQFPAVPNAQDERARLPEAVAEEPEPPKAEYAEPQETAESHPDEESHKEDDIHDLPLEDSSANDPPEAFPEGYFLQHFQGLRRLPEPTKEEVPVTSIPPTEETSSDVPQEEQNGEDQTTHTATESVSPSNEDLNKISKDPTSEMEMFMHLRPFQGFHSPQWAPSMLHQPVYVFSYQHPESYGYHYYY